MYSRNPINVFIPGIKYLTLKIHTLMKIWIVVHRFFIGSNFWLIIAKDREKVFSLMHKVTTRCRTLFLEHYIVYFLTQILKNITLVRNEISM